MENTVWLVGLAEDKKRYIIASVICAMISEILGLVPFVIIYLVIVKLLAVPFDGSGILELALLAVLAVVGRYLFLYASLLLSHIASFDIGTGLRRKILAHLGNLSMGYFGKKEQGAINKMLTEDIDRIDLFVSHHIPDMVSCTLLPLLAVLFMMLLDWRLALVSLVPLPIALYVWSSVRTRVALDGFHKIFTSAMEKMNGTIIEFVRGIQVIKIFNQTVHSFERFVDSVTYVKRINIEYDTKFSFSWAMLEAVTGSALLLILPAGLWLFLGGSISLTTLLFFLIIGIGYLEPLNKLVRVWSSLSRVSDCVSRVQGFLAEPPLPAPACPRLPENNDVRFSDVCFSYGEVETIRHVSFEAREGTVTALVGPSGAGKSTLASLIPRLWDVNSGSITIGGVDIRDVPYDVLADCIAVVFQDVSIFSDTVLENIRMGKAAPDAEVVAAAKAAQIHDLIVSLPGGYGARIGDGGIQLSGGERQRISIARAILKNAPIVILDEATSFADPENEARIKDAFAELIHGKTVIVIAHCLSSVTDSDQIVVMDRGQVVGTGNHNGLVADQPLYRAMWEAHVAAREWAV